MFQGPIADALTHVGQLALMRGMIGAPVRPESYARAAIAVGRTGRDQSAARTEFDGDASPTRGPSPLYSRTLRVRSCAPVAPLPGATGFDTAHRGAQG